VPRLPDFFQRRPDPTDRRAALICLTDRGWDEVRAALAIIAELERDWARRLGKRRMAQLCELLAELDRTAEQPAPGPHNRTCA
jgi:DNA-binding MarR family transcriptional regulator